MKLFIGNLPADALLIDIYEFLGGLNLQASFEPRQGCDCNRRDYHYVIAQLADNHDIDQLIHSLDGLSFQGQSLAVRQFQERNPCPQDWQLPERRYNLH